MRQVNAIQTYLNSVMKGRENVVEAVLAAVLSGNHVFMFGPPGTGKSMVANEFAKTVNERVFTLLFGRSTEPDAVFGPIRLSMLKQDLRRHNTTGYLPEARIAFLDEVWKANNVVLNAMLTILNERRFDNGDEKVTCPLQTAIMASNEIPEDATLLALYDRCLFRLIVDYADNKADFDDIVFGDFDAVEPPQVNLDEMLAEYAELSANFNVNFLRARYNEFIVLCRQVCPLSDRRARQMIQGAKALYILRGKECFDDRVWVSMVDMIWHEPADRDRLLDVMRKHNFVDLSDLELEATKRFLLENCITHGVPTSGESRGSAETRHVTSAANAIGNYKPGVSDERSLAAIAAEESRLRAMLVGDRRAKREILEVF